MIDQIRQDIWTWLTDYVEVNHKFYDYKFPPCPYARGARLRGLVDVRVYEQGSAIEFIQAEIADLIAESKYNVRILVLPPRARWDWRISRFVNRLNQRIIADDFYAQYGTANHTISRYPGWFNWGAYSIVIVNRLSDVLDGHRALTSTEYYRPWAKSHYDAVVTRRQHMYEKHKKHKEN
jgi:hypothetical protein